MEKDKAFFSWETHEEKQVERSNDWYWGLGLIAVFGSAGAFIAGNFLFGVLIILSAIVLFVFAKKDIKPKVFQVTSKGILRGDLLHRYKTLEAFWIDIEDEEGPALILHTSRVFDPVISIPIGEEIDLDNLRNFLKNVVHEQYIQEPRFHKILDKIGL